MTIKLLASDSIRQTLTNNLRKDNSQKASENKKIHIANDSRHEEQASSSNVASQACSNNDASKINTHSALTQQRALAHITEKKVLALSENPIGYKPPPEKIILQWAVALQQEVDRPIDIDMLKNILQQRDALQHDKTLSRGDRASKTRVLSKAFYTAQHVSKEQQKDVLKSAIKYSFDRTIYQLKLSIQEWEYRLSCSQTFKNIDSFPGVNGTLSQTISDTTTPFFAEKIISTATGISSGVAGVIIGKIVEPKKGIGTATADMKRKGIFVPAKDYWDVPQRSIAIKQMKHSLAFLEKLKASGFDLPEQLKSLVEDCHALYKNVNAKNYCAVAEKLPSIAISALGSLTATALDKAAVTSPVVAIAAIPLSVLCKVISSLLGDGVGGLAKMDQIRTQNFLRSDILDSDGEIDVNKVSQLYLQPKQIEEKYIQTTLHRQIARTLYDIEKKERKLSNPSYPLSQELSSQHVHHRRLAEIEEEIRQTQYRIQDIKPRVNKSQYMDIKILIDLKNLGIDATLLKTAVALVGDSVIAEHKKWQNEHASNPTEYTNTVCTFFDLPEKLKQNMNSSQPDKTSALIDNKENLEGQQTTKMPTGQGKLAYLESHLVELQRQYEELLHQQPTQNESINQSCVPNLSSLNSMLKNQCNLLFYGLTPEEKAIRGRLRALTVIEQNKVKLRDLLADYNIFQQLTEAVHTKKSPDDLKIIIDQLRPGTLKTLLTNKGELEIAAGKFFKAMPEVLFGGPTADQVHPQAEEQASRYYDAFLQKIKPFAPDGGQLPDLKGMRPFLKHYQSLSLDFLDRADIAVNDFGKSTAGWILAAPYLIQSMHADHQIKKTLKDL